MIDPRRRICSLRYVHQFLAAYTNRIFEVIPLIFVFFASIFSFAASAADLEGLPLQQVLPPMPPNCPDLPELQNLKLPDGQLVDVRIFRDGGETFYIPFSWLTWQRPTDFPVPGAPWPSLAEKSSLNYTIEKIECPGVVHEGEFGFATPLVTRRSNAKSFVPPNFSDESGLDQIRIIREDATNPYFRSLTSDDNFLRGNKGTGEAMIRASNTHWINYDYFVGRINPVGGAVESNPVWQTYRSEVRKSLEWIGTRQQVLGLYEWLKTYPKDRDNHHVFKLGEIKQ